MSPKIDEAMYRLDSGYYRHNEFVFNSAVEATRTEEKIPTEMSDDALFYNSEDDFNPRVQRNKYNELYNSVRDSITHPHIIDGVTRNVGRILQVYSPFKPTKDYSDYTMPESIDATIKHAARSANKRKDVTVQDGRTVQELNIGDEYIKTLDFQQQVDWVVSQLSNEEVAKAFISHVLPGYNFETEGVDKTNGQSFRIAPKRYHISLKNVTTSINLFIR